MRWELMEEQTDPDIDDGEIEGEKTESTSEILPSEEPIMIEENSRERGIPIHIFPRSEDVSNKTIENFVTSHLIGLVTGSPNISNTWAIIGSSIKSAGTYLK